MNPSAGSGSTTNGNRAWVFSQPGNRQQKHRSPLGTPEAGTSPSPSSMLALIAPDVSSTVPSPVRASPRGAPPAPSPPYATGRQTGGAGPSSDGTCSAAARGSS